MGHFWATVHVGVRFKGPGPSLCDGPGLLGLPSIARSRGPALKTQSPEQDGGCRCLPNFLQIDGFPPAQLMPCLSHSSLTVLLSFGFSPAMQQPVEQSFHILRSRVAHRPRHSPKADAARPPACAPPLLPLFSSHSFPRVRTTAGRSVVSRCRVRTAPRYIVRSPLVACAASCLRLC